MTFFLCNHTDKKKDNSVRRKRLGTIPMIPLIFYLKKLGKYIIITLRVGISAFFVP